MCSKAHWFGRRKDGFLTSQFCKLSLCCVLQSNKNTIQSSAVALEGFSCVWEVFWLAFSLGRVVLLRVAVTYCYVVSALCPFI